MARKKIRKVTHSDENTTEIQQPVVSVKRTFPAKYLIIALVISAITFVAFIPAIQNGFTNWDDPSYIQDNPYIRSLNLENIKAIFFPKTEILDTYTPLTILSYAVEYSLVKLNPMLYHVDNIILHVINTFLVFWFLLLISKRIEVPIIGALLFGIHTMHVESVAWLAERKDLLFTLFYLGSIISYVIYLTERSAVKNLSETLKDKYFILTIVFFLLALLSKPQAVSLPLVLLLIDYIKQRKISGSVWIEKLPFFLLSLLFGIRTLLSMNPVAIPAFEQYNILDKLLFSSYAVVIYISKFLLPLNLSNYYPFPVKTEGMYPILVYLSPAIILLLAYSVFLSLKRTRILAFGFGFFLVNLIFVIHIIAFNTSIHYDRFSYMSYIGLAYLVGEGFVFLSDRANEGSRLFKNLKYAGLTILVIYGAAVFALTWERNAIWRNGITLWSDTIHKYPNVAMSYNNRGNIYYYSNKPDEAMADFNKAILLDEKHAGAYFNRALLFTDLGDQDMAIADYSRSIEFDEGFVHAYYNRGVQYYFKKEYEKAASDYSNAIELNPEMLKALRNRGLAYIHLEEFELALSDFTKTIELDPSSADVYNERANVLFMQEDYDNAILDYSKAIELNTEFVRAYFNRGIAYFKIGFNSEAITDFTAAIEYQAGYASAYFQRALAHYEKKEYEAAWDDALKAQELEFPVDSTFLARLQQIVQ
ncbi:MAG: tetratricopeptide repeat protein [Bacteroidetes bacterium]|nr:tetratricopeptide repeat protein [Bacteroidota bacterium]